MIQNFIFRTFLQVMALLLTLSSAIFLAKGAMALSVNDIAKLSQPKFDYNLDVASNLSSNRADTIVGVCLLITAVLFQMVNLLWPNEYADFKINIIGVILAVVISLIVLKIGWVVSAKIQHKTLKEVKEI